MQNQAKIRILIIDDDEEDFVITRELIMQIRESSFTVDWCFIYEEAIEKICKEEYDLYFIDFRLGAKTGLDLLRDAIAANCERPMILLTGRGDQKIDKEAMHAGAIDYLVKSELNSEKLERCIRYSLERSLSLRQLRINERKFRNIFEKSKDVIFLADEGLIFRDINPAGEELFGYSKEEFFNLSLESLIVNPSDGDSLRKMLESTGEFNDQEFELQTRSGERISCIISVSIQSDIIEGKYVQGIIHDISNIKKSEKANLQVEKLRAAGRLVSTLAHEVRNPLNNINLSVAQLDVEVSGGETRVFLDIINRNAKRVGDLITELLSSARPTDMILERKCLQGIIDETISAAADRISLKRIRLNLYYPEVRIYILADSAKLRIAFLNIIINAIEAMKDDVGNLDITVGSDDKYYKVVISDNGMGINEENLSRLFEPYFTSKKNGLGLGLVSTLNIIQSHKGNIEVKSIKDGGTSFIISFEKA